MDRVRLSEAAPVTLDWGREIGGDLDVAERREWLCTNGLGGFASATLTGSLTRRYHGLLVAALAPPLGRTLVVSKVDETVRVGGIAWPLSTNRWAGDVVDPHGYRHLERFRLDGTTPVWTYACADALLEKRIWMEQGANTTYVRYRVLRAGEPLALDLKMFVNYRDYHATARGHGWRMLVEEIERGLRVTAFAGATPIVMRTAGDVEPGVAVAHTWYERFYLARDHERGLEAEEDHLHAGTIEATLRPGQTLALVLSTEPAAGLDVEAAWARRIAHETGVRARWRAAQPATAPAEGWVEQLALAADQFIVRRPTPDDADGASVIAGYHWFGDWGRDTMIGLDGLTLATGRPEIAARILRTFARHVDRGMLPNRFPDQGETPEYNTVDATLWYVEAIRAYHAATSDDGLLKELFPILESIVQWHLDGTRYRIAVDPTDGLLRAGEPGVQLTWMDARVGDWVVTPRIGKPVEINALWYNALVALVAFARRLGRPEAPWARLAARVEASFSRFWNPDGDYCHDVIDGPAGDDATLRPNQILAVSLPASPLPRARQKAVVDVCARRLLTSYGLRSLAPGSAEYRGTYGGDQTARDGGYHQGPAWAWLLGPFALAHFRVYGDVATARSFLAPMAQHLADYGLGSIAEIFEGDPPFHPCGCIAQAWSVAETLRAWRALA